MSVSRSYLKQENKQRAAYYICDTRVRFRGDAPRTRLGSFAKITRTFSSTISNLAIIPRAFPSHRPYRPRGFSLRAATDTIEKSLLSRLDEIFATGTRSRCEQSPYDPVLRTDEKSTRRSVSFAVSSRVVLFVERRVVKIQRRCESGNVSVAAIAQYRISFSASERCERSIPGTNSLPFLLKWPRAHPTSGHLSRGCRTRFQCSKRRKWPAVSTDSVGPKSAG